MVPDEFLLNFYLRIEGAYVAGLSLNEEKFIS